MTFVMGTLVGAVAMSYWSKNSKMIPFSLSNTMAQDTLKNIIQKNPDVQHEVNKIAEDNHIPVI
jgi:hypothetical protein